MALRAPTSNTERSETRRRSVPSEEWRVISKVSIVTTHIVVVDDHPEMRDLIRTILASDGTFEVVGEASDGYGAIELVETLRPDIVVMDIGLPVIDGVTTTRIIVERFASVAVVVLTIQDAPQSVARALRSGASGYVVKHAMGRDLVPAIAAAHKHERYVSPVLALTDW